MHRTIILLLVFSLSLASGDGERGSTEVRSISDSDDGRVDEVTTSNRNHFAEESKDGNDNDHHFDDGTDEENEDLENNSNEDEHHHHNHEHHHHQVEKRDLNERIWQHINEQQRSGNYTGCHTCRKMHLDMKQASLDHIKKYVLSFLGFKDSGPPKKPGAWPSVPHYIMEEYYAKTVSSEYWEERAYQRDQQKYMDMGPGGGTTDQDDYMADDPNWNLRQSVPKQQDDEPFRPLVKTNRIYLFPNVTKFRHQQHDLMSFEFPDTMSKRKKNHSGKNANSQSPPPPHDSLNPLLYLDVTRAVLHVSFCNEHSNPALLADLRTHYESHKSPFRVVVHRLIAKDQQQHPPPTGEKFSKEEVAIEVPTHILEELLYGNHNEGGQRNNASESGGKRRNVCRRRVELDISQMVKDWYKYAKKNHGLLLTTEPARLRNLISMKQTVHKPFLEIWTESTRKKRVKREMSMNCKEGDYERRCCMYPLKVDFELFGWDFIIAPKQYEANYCAGECSINFLPSYTHTHMMQLSTSAPACCSPKKMQPLSLLYFNRKEEVIYTKMENMIVETCGCS